jgi:5-methylcytosine-specific restriction endonuclease McrA
MKVLARAGWRCERCGSRGPLIAHHVVPLERGGDNDPRNGASLCIGCHNRLAHRLG